MAKQFKAWGKGNKPVAQKPQEDVEEVASVEPETTEAGPVPAVATEAAPHEPVLAATSQDQEPITRPRAKAFAVAPGRTIATNRGMLSAGTPLVSSDFPRFEATIARLLAKRAVVEL